MEPNGIDNDGGFNSEIRKKLLRRYGPTFQQLCILSSYSKYKPSCIPAWQRLWLNLKYCVPCIFQPQQDTSPIDAIKIDHLKFWVKDKYLGPELTSGFCCTSDANLDDDELVNLYHGRKTKALDTTCLRAIHHRQRYLLRLIDQCDEDKDGMLSEYEFLLLMFKVHEACCCSHGCQRLIDAVPKVSNVMNVV